VLKKRKCPACLPQGISYIDTCNLDGETNLKIKSSLAATNFANTHGKVR
jgi:magnesium-transporting ATPase (P-type)